MQFKVMYYNIWHGFHSEWQKENPTKPFIFYPERLEAAKQAVRDEKPDILVLGEACFSTPFIEISTGKTIHINYQKEFNFPNDEYIPREYEWGASILSRFKIKGVDNLTTERRTFIRSEILAPHIFLDIVHPHPTLSEDEKTEFLKKVVSQDRKNYLLVGDFNALSDEDIYDREQLSMAFARIMGTAASQKISDMLRCEAVRFVRSTGLIDTFRANNSNFDYTIPTDILSPHKNSAIRIDYIFCSPDFKIKEAYILKNSATERASDHYPVVAVLEV